MDALKVIIHTLAPVLATQAQSDEPNSATSLGFIPGSMIRGALISRYRGEKSADDARFRELFLDGSVRFLNAYPAHGNDDERSLPKPLSWLIEKDRADQPVAPIYDFGVKKRDMDSPLKSPEGEFYWRNGDSVQMHTTKRSIIVHNASDERSVKKSRTSQVFRYEAIAADERFVGFIVSDDVDLLNAIKPLVIGRYSIGGSHTAGYGRVEISLAQNTPIENWREAVEDESEYDEDDEGDEGSKTTLSKAGLVTLTCLSDIVLPVTASSVTDWLNSVFDAKPKSTHFRLRVVGGFNRTWGLPLPQSWAIQIGSVFTFDQSHKPLLDARADHGIGERLAEGFGRVAVNLNGLSELRLGEREEQTRSARTTRDEKPKLSEASASLAARMARRAWLAQVERQLEKRISELSGTVEPSRFKNLPKPAQLSQARLAARQAWLSADLSPIQKYVVDVKKSKPRSRDWEGARIGSTNLLDWIEAQTQSAEFQSVDAEFRAAGVSPEWNSKDQRRMVARLVEGVMRRAVQVAKKQRDGGR